MKILQINKFHFDKGGSETAYFGISHLLETHGHTVIPFSMKHSSNFPSSYEKYFVENVSYDAGGAKAKISAAAKIVYSLDARDKMRALLRDEHPDVAHFHIFQHQISPSVFSPLREKGIPLILTLHDLKPLCPNYKMLVNGKVCEKCKGRKFYNCFLSSCSKGSKLKSLVNTIEMYFHYAMGFYQSVDRFIAVSEFYRRKMIEFGFPAEKVVHIPNCIDTTRFQPSEIDKGYGLFFGRLSEEKGVATLLRALVKEPQRPFFIVGTGPAERELKDLAAQLGLTNTRFLGFKKGDELRTLVRECAFTVIPSEWYENCPMSVLESLAFGKTVVGARIGGIPELVEEGGSGLTFESGNSDDLAEKMRLLWDDPAGRKAMGQAGRLRVEQNHAPEKTYQSVIALYHEVCR